MWSSQGSLHLFEELYAETEDENKGKAEAEEEAGADFIAMGAIKQPTDDE